MKKEESGSITGSQRHGSADPDPDPHQNVKDPQHWLKAKMFACLVKCSQHAASLLTYKKNSCYKN